LVNFIVAGIDYFHVYGHVDIHVNSQAYAWASYIDITVNGQSYSWTFFIEVTSMASIRWTSTRRLFVVAIFVPLLLSRNALSVS
jgi:hypothetical protein